jgi:diguanylate cyclase (GGDEF)-like protein/PAS domain S-box-containing protein
MLDKIKLLINDTTKLGNDLYSRIEDKLYREKARAEIALNSISDAVICTDILGNIDYLNTAAEEITGWLREEAHGMPISKVFKIMDGATRKPSPNPVDFVLKCNKPRALAANTVLVSRDGDEVTIEDSISPIHNWDGKLTGAVIVFHDISASQAMSIKMAHLAHHDFLTNLPNRVLLNDRIAHAIKSAKRSNKQLAVLFLDLDNFKHINDSLGHETGDILLKSVAQRLTSCIRSSDTISRQGGDEFIILLDEGKNGESASSIAEKIQAALTLPHTVNNRELHITTSIGISIYPLDGQDAETLIKCADTAMYHAKKKGRNNHQFFRSEMNIRAVNRQLIETDLRIAIDKQEFFLLYQPKVNLITGKITGAEALVRWKHPKLGDVTPKKFVTIAEDSSLIVPIGRWVLLEACTQAKQWINMGLQAIPIAVNISAHEFHQKNFVANVRSILDDTGLDARFLELEITESTLMRDVKSTTLILHELKSMGIQLAVDDFGTGYSSLSYLKQFPIDVLKIDQSFVNDIATATDSGIIVSAVIGMGNNLKLHVVAEGIENLAQLTFLKQLYCAEGQGYYFSKPLSPTEFTILLETNTSLLSQELAEHY